MKIDKIKIGPMYPPFIIAELSANHSGSIKKAKNLIKAAKLSGANAVKIQTYTPDTMTINSKKNDFLIKEGIWKGNNLYSLYKKAYTPYEWHKELFDYAKKNKIILFSTPFDETAVDLLQQLNTPAYKIASFELTDLPLIEYTAKIGKPILLSTGMSKENEIINAIECCKKYNNKNILLFHCISSYPAETKESNLKSISYLANQFKVNVGLSDHTTNNLASIISISLGACAIEKHFKINQNDKGPDSSFSILPNQFKKLVEECNTAFIALGKYKLKRSKSEKSNKRFRRSLYFIKDLKKNHIINSNDIKRIRPGFGLEPKYYKKIIGKKLLKNVERGDPVNKKNILF